MSAPPHGTTLTLRNISAGYGQLAVVKDVSLAVEPGSLVALLGPSGCGKTTLLRVIAGLLPPHQGDILFDAVTVTSLPAEKRRAAMVFQKPLLFPHRDVAGNVAFGLEMQGVPAREIAARVAEALHWVQLDHFAARRPGALSGGQEQRVALARALVTSPRVLLLDEPFSALDESLRADMRSLVRGLQKRLGITTVFVTHDQQEAVQVADRIAVILDGRLEQVGVPRQFYEQPASPDVARFFGWQSLDGVGKCQTFFRAERAHIVPTREQSPTSDLELSATLRELTDLGTHLACHVTLPSGITVQVHSPIPETPPPSPGDPVLLRIPHRALVRF